VHLEAITGRYAHVELAGQTYRTYFEQAGSGIPLVCLHTAGADSRQYRHLLNDTDIAERFQIIAFDMPRHGRSLPPDGTWTDRYSLTRRFYMDFIEAFCAGLDLERPALLGCSMGGYLMLDLAIERPGTYRALIAVQPRAYAPYWTALNSIVDSPDYNFHSIVAVVRAFSSPRSPADRRREVEWIYSQGGPGVIAGDFEYAGGDHDVRDRLAEIDPSGVGLFVIAGDGDLSCLPEHTDELLAAAPGLPVVRIADAGHFPPSENPRAFRAALLPILDTIAAPSRAIG